MNDRSKHCHALLVVVHHIQKYDNSVDEASPEDAAVVNDLCTPHYATHLSSGPERVNKL